MKHKTDLHATKGKNVDADTEIKSLWEGDDVPIYSYSRKQAIEDGVLIDVSETAKEAGFRVSVAMTSAAWAACANITESDSCQDEVGRLWDVLNVLRSKIVSSRVNSDCVSFCVAVLEEQRKLRAVQLKSLCGPGDNGEPVITIMLPDED